MTANDPRSSDAIDLARKICDLWKDQPHPAIVGAALAQALAIWLATLPAEHRDGHFEDHIASVKRLLPVVQGLIKPSEAHQTRS